MASITRGGLLIPLLLVAGACARDEQAEPEVFLIPSGYVGEVVVLFDVADGVAAEIQGGRRIYRIPPSGILRTQLPPAYGRATWSFAYVGASGDESIPIPRGPLGTIEDTPQNRAHSVVEIVRLQIGTTAKPRLNEPGQDRSDAPCSRKFYRLFVGTRAQYLDEPRTIDIDQHLEQNQAPCGPAD